MKKWLTGLFQGVALGASVIVPGVSGGTMAVLIGVYDKLLSSIGGIFKRFKESVLFLLPLLAGGLVGVVGLGLIINPALDRYPFPTMFLFLGIIVGGLPALYKTSGIGRVKPRDFIPFAAGLIAVIVTTSFSASIADLPSQSGAGPFLALVFVGVLAGVALVLPGLSGSFFLAAVGIYKDLFDFRNLNFGLWLPLGIGILVGVFFSSLVIEKLMRRYPRGMYALVFGLIIASIYAIVRDCINMQNELGALSPWQVVMTVLCFAIGVLLISFITEAVMRKRNANAALANDEPAESIDDGSQQV